jgi:hypothetical protein
MTHYKLGAVKLYVCLSSVYTALGLHVAFTVGAEALTVVFTLFLATLGLLDAVVNDLMPAQYEAPRVYRWRYVIFVALAGVQMNWLYPQVLNEQFGGSTLRYAVDALAAIGVALLDFNLRFYRMNAQHEPHSDPNPTA